MHDVGHAVAQLAALFARYPWQSFAVVMAAVFALLTNLGRRFHRVWKP